MLCAPNRGANAQLRRAMNEQLPSSLHAIGEGQNVVAAGTRSQIARRRNRGSGPREPGAKATVVRRNQDRARRGSLLADRTPIRPTRWLHEDETMPINWNPNWAA